MAQKSINRAVQMSNNDKRGNFWNLSLNTRFFSEPSLHPV